MHFCSKIVQPLVLISILLFSPILSAGEIEGRPVLRTYMPYDYLGHQQNWAMLMAPSGLLYVANGKGILEYDGRTWRKIRTPYDGRVRSLAINKSGRIYAGALSSFGYLTEDDQGQMTFVDISNKVKNEHREFGDIWKVALIGEDVYFVSSLYLFRVNPDNTIDSWKTAKSHFRNIISLDNKITIFSKNEVYQLDQNDQLKLKEIYTEQMEVKKVAAVVEWSGNTLLLSSNAIFQVKSQAGQTTIIPWKNKASEALKGKYIYAATNYQDEYIAVSTISHGLFLIKKDGSSVKNITTQDGLVSNVVLGMVEDNQAGLWLGLEGGIQRLQSPDRLAIVIDHKTGGATFNDLVRYQDHLVVALASGIAVQVFNGEKQQLEFKPLANFSSQLFSLVNTKHGLLTVGNGGIYRVKWDQDFPEKSAVEKLIEHAMVYGLTPSQWREDEYFVSMDDGLGILTFKDNQWQLDRVDQVPSQLHGMEFDSHGLWLASASAKVYLVKPFEDINNIEVEIFDSNHGVFDSEIKIYPHEQGVLIAGENKLAQFDKNKRRFQPIGEIDSRYDIQYLNKTPNGHYWMGTEFGIGKIEGLTKLDSMDLSLSKLLEPSRALDILFDEKYHYLIREKDIVSFSLPLSDTKLLKPVLRSVYPKPESIKQQKITPLKGHFAKFDFSLPDFVNPKLNQYRFKLNQDEWTEWSSDTSTSFRNLMGGEYSLIVQSSNYKGEVSENLISFSVPLYWYQTNWFKLISVALLLLLIWLFSLIVTARLRRKNILLEQLVAKRTETIAAQTKELQRLGEARTRFFTHVSHELRTPLTLTIGPLEEVIDERYGKISKGVKQALALVLKSASSMRELLNQVLDLSRMQGGSLSLKLEGIDLVVELHRCCEPFQLLAAKQGIDFRTSFSQTKLMALIDRKGIHSIVNNLLSNAFKFTAKGGVICLDLAVDPDFIYLTVTDNGCGIPDDEIEHVFDQYYQAGSKEIELYSGTGIGLSMVQEYVDLHGGSIEVTSKVAQGTIFKVTLPLLLAEELNQNSEATRIDPLLLTTSEQQSPKVSEFALDNNLADDTVTALVVEDNLELREFIAQRLSISYRVLQAENGQQGLEIANDQLPDVVITDIMMPVMDGHSLCKALKSSKHTDCIPVVMLTSKGTGEEIITGINMGADDYLSKPFAMAELLARINRLIESRLTLKQRYSSGDFLTTAGQAINQPALKNESERFIDSVRAAVLGHQSDNVGVKEIALALSMDRTTLYRKLKNATGKTPVEAIRSIRLEEAAQLFKSRSSNVTEVAYAVGFKSLGHFSRSFSDYFGMSPTDYIARNKG